MDVLAYQLRCAEELENRMWGPKPGHVPTTGQTAAQIEEGAKREERLEQESKQRKADARKLLEVNGFHDIATLIND